MRNYCKNLVIKIFGRIQYLKVWFGQVYKYIKLYELIYDCLIYQERKNNYYILRNNF